MMFLLSTNTLLLPIRNVRNKEEESTSIALFTDVEEFFGLP